MDSSNGQNSKKNLVFGILSGIAYGVVGLLVSAALFVYYGVYVVEGGLMLLTTSPVIGIIIGIIAGRRTYKRLYKNDQNNKEAKEG